MVIINGLDSSAIIMSSVYREAERKGTVLIFEYKYSFIFGI